MSGPIALPPGAGRTLWLLGSEITIKAGGAESGGAYSFVEYRTPGGGTGPLAHTHTDREETFYVLAGEVEFLIGEEHRPAPPGSFLMIPRGVLHTFANTGAEEARLLIIHTPSGMEAYFEELATLLSRETPELAAVIALMKRYGMEVPGT